MGGLGFATGGAAEARRATGNELIGAGHARTHAIAGGRRGRCIIISIMVHICNLLLNASIRTVLYMCYDDGRGRIERP